MKWVSIIVNYRSADLTIDCLRTLEPEIARFREHPDGGPIRIIVTDNQSPDDSVEVLAHAIAEHGWGDWVQLLPLPENGGFAYGNNRGIEAALAIPESEGGPPDVLHLLNPDTLVRDHGLVELAKFLNAHPQVGIAGSRLEDPDGKPQHSAFRFYTLGGEFTQTSRFGPALKLLKSKIIAPPVSDEPCPTDWVAGASMAIRRAVIDEVGLIDEGYFMYFEELDFTMAAAKAGWPCWYVPKSRIVHLVGQVSGVSKAVSEKAAGVDTPAVPVRRKRRPKYWFEARAYFWNKNHGRVTRTLADLTHVLGLVVHRTHISLRGRPNDDPPHLLSDFIRFNFLGGLKDSK